LTLRNLHSIFSLVRFAVNVLKTTAILQKDLEEKHESHEETIGDQDDCSKDGHCMELYSRTKESDIFYMDTATIGKSRITVDLIWANDTKNPGVSDMIATSEFINPIKVDKMYRVKLLTGLFAEREVDFSRIISNAVDPKIHKPNMTEISQIIDNIRKSLS